MDEFVFEQLTRANMAHEEAVTLMREIVNESARTPKPESSGWDGRPRYVHLATHDGERYAVLYCTDVDWDDERGVGDQTNVVLSREQWESNWTAHAPTPSTT